MTTFGLAEVATRLVEESVESPVLLPLHEVPVDDPPGGQVLGIARHWQPVRTT